MTRDIFKTGHQKQFAPVMTTQRNSNSRYSG